MGRPVETSRLVGHVKSLAGDIGERNFFDPPALAAAADYIESCWRQQGHVVDRKVAKLTMFVAPISRSLFAGGTTPYEFY